MELILNGDRIDVPDGVTVADLVADHAGQGADVGRGGGREVDRPRGVAVAIDGAVVPGSQWATTALSDGQHVEVLTAVHGG